jgi:hypothetical protein
MGPTILSRTRAVAVAVAVVAGVGCGALAAFVDPVAAVSTGAAIAVGLWAYLDGTARGVAAARCDTTMVLFGARIVTAEWRADAGVTVDVLAARRIVHRPGTGTAVDHGGDVAVIRWPAGRVFGPEAALFRDWERTGRVLTVCCAVSADPDVVDNDPVVDVAGVVVTDGVRTVTWDGGVVRVDGPARQQA